MSATAQDLAGPLRWERQGVLSREYSLRGARGVLASLRWPKAASDRAEGRAGTQGFLLTRKGLFRPVVTVARLPFEDVAATVRLSGGGGRMETADGAEYELARPSGWKGTWSLRDGQGRELATITVPAFKLRVGEVRLSEEGRRSRQLPFLLLVAWYVIVPKLDRSGGA